MLTHSTIPPRRITPPQTRPPGYEPGYVAWEPRFKGDVAGVFMAIFGLEERGPDTQGLRQRLIATFAEKGGPNILETGRVRPGYGEVGQIWFGYWSSPEAYSAWIRQDSVAALWRDDAVLTGNVGLWREECLISLDHNETSYSRDQDITGLGKLSDGLAITQLHGYWGSLRDRLVAAADDGLDGTLSPQTLRGGTAASGCGKRRYFQAPENICVIRTSQDIVSASADQLATYRRDVEPAYLNGLNFLRGEQGDEAGCIGMRLLDEVGDEGTALGRTCALGFFTSLAALEQWTHHHPTHHAIMKAFVGLVQTFNGVPGLNLWHEVSVLPAHHMKAEYINCSGDGGLLRIA